MKKIIAFLLLVTMCVPALFSCEETEMFPNAIPDTGILDAPVSDVESVSQMFARSLPTKVVASTRQVILEDVLVLNCNYEIVTGYVNGGMSAFIYKSHVEELRTIEDGGNNDEVKPLVKTTDKVVEGIEGFGTRTDGGEWNPEGAMMELERGKMSLALKESNMKNIKFENNVLSFVIPSGKATKVLGSTYGKDIDGEVAVTITVDGAYVLSIELTYELKGDKDINLDDSLMYVRVDYSYDLELITIK